MDLVETVLSFILRTPIALGILGAWSCTQMHKWLTPPGTLVGWTDHQRVFRTRQIAITSGMVFTLLAYMNPELGGVHASCFTVLGMAVCSPPFKAFVYAPLVGMISIPAWDFAMWGVESKFPDFYKKYISGRLDKHEVFLQDGTPLLVLTDARGRFMKLQELSPSDEGFKTVVITRPQGG